MMLVNSNRLPDGVCADSELKTRTLKQLNDYLLIWPIINTLKKQGPAVLINILEHTSEPVLAALLRLSNHSDLNTLIAAFLVKDSIELEQINRKQIIQFLRQPDLSGILIRHLDVLCTQASDVMSQVMLSTVTASYANELDRLSELRFYLETYPFTIWPETGKVIADFYQHELQNKLFSLASSEFIGLLHDLLLRMELANQADFIKKLTKECLLLVIEHCLKASVQDSVTTHLIGGQLLTLLCAQSGFLGEDLRCLIKNRLEQPDSYLMPELAKHTVPTHKELKNGVIWLHELLLSPHCIAKSTIKTLALLGDRVRHYASTLDHVDLIRWLASFNESSALTKDIEECLQRIEQMLHIFGDTQAYWCSKKYKMRQFIIERIVNALFINLEERCEQLSDSDPATANKALNKLYSHYHRIYFHLRSDLLLRAINYFYYPVAFALTDVEVAPSFLSVQEFQTITEARREKEVILYNAAGQKIGFVHESNEAMAFVDDEPVLLIQSTLVQAGQPLYNKEGLILGYLTESGQISKANEIQKNTYARLLAVLPEKQLERSSLGIDLIVRTIFFDNSFAALYAELHSEHASTKRQWLESLFLKMLSQYPDEIPAATIQSLVDNLSDETTFALMPCIRNKATATHLFHAVLHQEKKRELFLNGFYETHVYQYWTHHNPAPCLADYLLHFYDKPWFSAGLLQFAHYGKKYKIDSLLNDALDLVANLAKTNQICCDALLCQLLCCEACAAVVLHEFLNKTDHSEIANMTRHFGKQHVLMALEHLNGTASWENKAQYRLVLHVLEKQFTVLFPADDAAWQSDELNKMICFIHRYLSTKCSFDSDVTIGHRVLGELVLRCAKAGTCSLFYSNKSFDTSLAKLSFPRLFLERLVDKFWIPAGLKEQNIDEKMRIKAWSNEQSAMSSELQDDVVFMDLRHLILQTWKDTNKKTLPVICVFLLNYSGPKRSVILLLRDYITSFTRKMDYLHPLALMLHYYPSRDVSSVVFEVLEAAVIQNPQIMDRIIFDNMAYFYTKKVLNQKSGSPEAQLNLLLYFGQNKYYSLVQIGCDQLALNCTDKYLSARLKKAKIEAKIENDLHSSLGHAYFKLLKIWKRTWHYGFNAAKNASQIVKFCDDNTPGSMRHLAVDSVTLPLVSKKVSGTLSGFSVKRNQLIRLLEAIKRSSMKNSWTTHTSNGKQSLFGAEQPSLVALAENTSDKQSALVTRS